MKDDGGRGCLPVALGLLLGFVAIEGGIVLIAWSLHHMLGSGFHPRWVTGAVAGVLILFAGPQLWFLAAGGRKHVTWRQAMAAAPDLGLAGWFVLGWAAPQVIGHKAAGLLVGVMVLEFVIIHASIMLVALPMSITRKEGDPWWKSERGAMAGLVLMYSVFAAGMSAGFKSAWLFIGFWMLVGNKFIGDWLAPAAEAEERKRRHMARWGVSAGLYLLLAMGSIFIPVPRLGAISGSSGDGLWERNPEQAVMLGALYFALLGFCELYGGFNKVSEATAAAETR
jgi:hypothetical protein